MSPICVPCERFMRMKKSGVYFIQEPEPALPYKLWAGDLWECPTCGHRLISGVGHAPLAEHYQQEFGRMVEPTNARRLIPIIKD